MTLSLGQIESWMVQLFWPFVRIGACFVAAPVFGAQFIPGRVKIMLAGAIAFIVAPLVTTPADISPFSIQGAIVTVQQIVIGLATGFALQLIFDALALGGQLLSNSMGLSFAFNVDPLRGASTPVIGQLYMLLVTLTFLALHGHMVLIETLVGGFATLPIGVQGLGPDAVWTLVGFGSQLFSGALAVALPGMTALLIVNLAFGVMSRAAPTLNLFAVGFPVTLIFGLAIVWAGLPAVQTAFVASMDAALTVLRQVVAR